MVTEGGHTEEVPGLSYWNSGLAVRKHGNECSLWHGFPLPTATVWIPAVLGDLTGLLPPVALWEALTLVLLLPHASHEETPSVSKPCLSFLVLELGVKVSKYIRQVFYLWTPPPPLPGEGHPKMEWNWRDNFFFVTRDFCQSFSQSQSWGQLWDVLHLDFKYFKKTLNVGGEKIALVTVCALESIWNVLEVHSKPHSRSAEMLILRALPRHLHFPKHSGWF